MKAKDDGGARLDDGRSWLAGGKEATTLRLVGWSRQRRVILLRRKLDRPLVLVDRTGPEQPLLSFAEIGPDREVWEYAALVTSLDSEIVTLGQLYRDRGDCENTFDELKNQWGWGGFTTHDLKRCRLLAGSVALIFNWWSLFVRLADLDHRPEAITSRPLLMQAIARQTQHAGQVTLTITSTHGKQHKARRAYRRIAGFLARLRQTAEQLDPVQRWYRILSEALKRYLKGPPTRPAAAPRAGLTCKLGLRDARNPARNSKPTAGFRIKHCARRIAPTFDQRFLQSLTGRQHSRCPRRGLIFGFCRISGAAHMSLSRDFAAFVADLSYEDLPPAVADRAKGVTLQALTLRAGRARHASQPAGAGADAGRGSRAAAGSPPCWATAPG